VIEKGQHAPFAFRHVEGGGVVELITSLQNDRVKLAHSLQQRARARRKERKIVLEGTRLIMDAVKQRHRPLFVLVDTERVSEAVVSKLAAQNIPILPVTPEIIVHTSDTNHPQGIVAVFPLPVPALPATASRVLILDNLRDPGNMGTLLRTAAAAGAAMVILSPGCADPYNPKTLRSGMGAHFRVPIVEATWAEIRNYCRTLSVYLATGDGEVDYDAVNWLEDWALIIGSEAHGLSEEAESLDAVRIRIPMAAQTESLNAGIAAGVILFEAARQRRRQ
jgi:TrmH family RNA methyltransferase